jgi:hypothetical protein
MSQYDFGTIDPNTKSGTALATDLNSWRTALHTTHGGSSAPSYITAGMIWLDTTSANYRLKMYDGAQSIDVAIIDATNNVARVAVDSAATSYITATTAAQIKFVIASVDTATIRSTGLQFNIASPYIGDSSNNELISFTTTASAVNQINVANSATGTNPVISAVGNDANIGITLTPKGTGRTNIGQLALDGTTITTTAAQLNFVAGVTSAIQTQIDGKAPLTGTGTSGTWPISISGNAATAGSKSFGTFTAAGGVAYATSTTALAAIGAGTAGQFLVSGGAGAPTWSSLSITDYQAFTASGTWTKPAGISANALAVVQMWAGGGSGGRGGGTYTIAEGGGGGGFGQFTIKASLLGATETITVGAGAAGVSAAGTGGTGGSSAFGAFATVFGGTGGPGNTNANIPGRGGSYLAAGVSTGAGSENSGADGASTYRAFNGGGGGKRFSGGTGSGNNLSDNGGNGGSTDGGAGSAPGGGGAGLSTNSGTSGAGARGEVRVWIIG